MNAHHHTKHRSKWCYEAFIFRNPTHTRTVCPLPVLSCIPSRRHRAPHYRLVDSAERTGGGVDLDSLGCWIQDDRFCMLLWLCILNTSLASPCSGCCHTAVSAFICLLYIFSFAWLSLNFQERITRSIGMCIVMTLDYKAKLLSQIILLIYNGTSGVMVNSSIPA